MRQQNLVSLIAAFLWLAAALMASYANYDPMQQEPSLAPLALLGCAIFLQLGNRLLFGNGKFQSGPDG